VSLLVRILEEGDGNVAVAAVDGEIDRSNVPEIADRLRRLLTNHSDALVVDLSDTTYIDSAGINLLFALGAALAVRQQELHLVVVPGSPIERTLKIVGADRSFPFHPDRDEALTP
jgi:anti-anti-sigma factor